MMSTKRWVLIGAASAVVLVALVVGALVMNTGAGRGDSSSEAPTKVVVVFAMAGEDDVVTAQLVTIVDPGSGSFELQETSATVSIPGTSFSLLRDAYPFGGAKAVATAIEGGSLKSGTAWVDVSPAAWGQLLASGVDVTITVPFDTYDDVTDHYSAFEVGPQRVAAADLRALVNGVAYLAPDSRQAILDAVAKASLRALASTTPPQGVLTSLSTEQWTGFAKALAKN
ncbi:MAG TPA: hypothetical protein VIK38_06745 [Coriobacteriia bacterium]